MHAAKQSAATVIGALALLALAGCATDDSQSACSSAICAGCCMGSICQPGNTVQACGVGGALCQACGAGQSCGMGSCTASPPDMGAGCSPLNCSGCCMANGACLAFPNVAACGIGGQLCTQCPGGHQCSNGACLPTRIDSGVVADGSTSCAADCPGCCDPTLGCIYWTSDQFCGLNGASCVDCAASNQSCIDEQCQALVARWQVMVISAKVDALDEHGEAWDSLIGSPSPPDPYVTVQLYTDTVIDNLSDTKDDTLTPVWNETLETYTSNAIVNTGLWFGVRDADGAGLFERMGGCGFWGPFKTSEIELTRADGFCFDSVEWLRIKLVPRP